MTAQHMELFVVWKSMIRFCCDNNHESDMNNTNTYQISF
jgi:hypothetical protein